MYKLGRTTERTKREWKAIENDHENDHEENKEPMEWVGKFPEKNKNRSKFSRQWQLLWKRKMRKINS